MSDVQDKRNIIKGNFKRVLKLSDLMNFLRKKCDLKRRRGEGKNRVFKKLSIKINYHNPSISNVDVFSIISDESYGYVNFKIVNGAIIQYTLQRSRKIRRNRQGDAGIVSRIRQRFHSISKEIYVPFKVDLGGDIIITVPKLGDKKRIVNLSERNAKYYRQEQFKQIKMIDPDRHVKRIMAQMQKDLRLSKEPRHIECFDNSNTQGTIPVAACVVFKNGKPIKK